MKRNSLEMFANINSENTAQLIRFFVKNLLHCSHDVKATEF